jgi:hypothetical protein
MPLLLPLLTLWRSMKFVQLIGFLIILYIVTKLFKNETNK